MNPLRPSSPQPSGKVASAPTKVTERHLQLGKQSPPNRPKQQPKHPPR
jgi:hypothetical protein